MRSILNRVLYKRGGNIGDVTSPRGELKPDAGAPPLDGPRATRASLLPKTWVSGKFSPQG